jgi:hypothetical protein
VETTSDILANRGGLSIFSRYLEQTRIFDLLEVAFGSLRKSSKGLAVWHLFHQLLCFFADGTSRHVSYFDQIKEDPGYAASIQVASEEMASSHTVKRFFRLFPWTTGKIFRRILKELFVWRLHITRPDLIVIGVDTMVMNNDYAKKRQGVTPTYRKKKGFQPIQFTWKGTIIDAVFRSGKWHGMTRGTAKEMIKELVHLIRSRYRSDATIVLEMDAGFFDQTYFKLCDDLNAGFVASGKMHPGVKEHVGQAGTPWREYRNPNQIWDYVEFGYRAGNWSRFYRAFYTRPRCNELDPQINLQFLRPDNVILTNLGTNPRVLQHLAATERKQLLKPKWIIEAHHQRGTEELTHRAFKDFGFEALPFKRFTQNQAFYYTMLVSFFLFQTFKEDVLHDVIPVTCYANTVRRRFIDIAGKIVRSGHQIIIKFPETVLNALNLYKLWKRCCQIIPIIAQNNILAH